MSKYYNIKLDKMDYIALQTDNINQAIYEKIKTKSKKYCFEKQMFIKFFSHYDMYHSGYIDYADFIKVLLLLGIIDEHYSEEDYKRYFNKISNNKKYIHYYHYYITLSNEYS